MIGAILLGLVRPRAERAHHRAATLAVLCGVALAALAASAARGATLTSSTLPLAGSGFQGGDGNQDDQSPYLDWQGSQAAGRVVHSADPNAADSAFAGGAKENKPGAWDLTTESGGVNPGKDNILDAWSVVDQPGAKTFLYLAFTRQEANGTTFVTFELNQDARLWNNGRARVPCRRTGDVLIVFAAHGNGMDVVLQRWVTQATDAATGCATTGSLDEVASVPAGDAQGGVNPGPIVNRLPGFYAASGTIPDAGQFGEAALNLGALIAAAFDDGCFAFGSVWMHSRSSTSESSQMQDYVAPRKLAVRTCAAAGTKFFDANANGRRDSGEPGIPRFLIWADYDGDGIRDASEPFTVSDVHGRYVLEDIRPPGGRYTLRETLLTRRRTTATSWRCSYPQAGTPGGFDDGVGGLFGCGWGPITAADTPYAQDRDFGNWLPAQLTVEKRLWPAGDTGRFDLKVNGTTVVPAAGDGASATIPLPPGSYDITESAVPPTDAGAYRSTVECRSTPRRRGRLRGGAAYEGLVLRAGDQATCTFTNVRPGSPAIAIEKTGPILATAGDTLRYTLYVTNPGDVPLPAATVKVSDRACDQPPALVGKAAAGGDDGSPQTLDPGDTWTYQCSNKTTAPTADCRPSIVTNIASATGEAAGTPVSDDASIATILRCPGGLTGESLPLPTQPGPPPPTPSPNPAPPAPAPVVSAGRAPPTAGRIGVAGLRVLGGCVARPSQVLLEGTHISQMRVTVDGRRVREATLEILQRRASVLPKLFAAGRHRVSVGVTFERGSGTPPVTLTRNVTVCAPPRRPNFTG